MGKNCFKTLFVKAFQIFFFLENDQCCWFLSSQFLSLLALFVRNSLDLVSKLSFSFFVK